MFLLILAHFLLQFFHFIENYFTTEIERKKTEIKIETFGIFDNCFIFSTRTWNLALVTVYAMTQAHQICIIPKKKHFHVKNVRIM